MDDRMVVDYFGLKIRFDGAMKTSVKRIFMINRDSVVLEMYLKMLDARVLLLYA